ncbi:hypothetical protein B6K86_09790 [Lachnospiraceae bacterium]|jgi:hypothetical protein|nr:hypothetical protein B6K86_09790 [Lachnospiraceae bacterium]
MEAIKKISAVEQVSEILLEHIQSPSSQIGDQLPTENMLCQEMELGRGTIREALKSLQGQGYIEILPGKGSFISSKTPLQSSSLSDWFKSNAVELQDLTAVRLALEPMATYLAIKNCSDAQLEELTQIHRKSWELVKNKDHSSLGKIDRDFHNKIFDICGNPFMIQINQLINGHLEQFRAKTFSIQNNVDNFIPAHEAIIRSFIDRNPKMGERKMKQHMEQVAKDLKRSQKRQ